MKKAIIFLLLLVFCPASQAVLVQRINLNPEITAADIINWNDVVNDYDANVANLIDTASDLDANSPNYDTAYTHSQATTNVHGLTFTGEGTGGGLDSDTVDGQNYSSTWPTTLTNIQSALTNDFHNIGGTDDDMPESGDFGAAADLEPNGALSADTVGPAEIADGDYGEIVASGGVLTIDDEGAGGKTSNTTPSSFTSWSSQTGSARKVYMLDDANKPTWAYIKSYDVLTPAQILTFSVSSSTLMVMAAGQTYTDIPAFTLTYQGTPSSCSIDISGGEVNPSDYPYAISSPYTSGSGPAVYARTSIASWTYTASATVDGQACSKTAYVYYYNEYRHGQTTETSGYDDTDVDNMASSALFNTTFTGTGSVKLSLSVNITSGNYFVFATPSRLVSAIAFKDHATGFAIDMSPASPYTVNNRTSARLFSETFYIYRSTNTGLGTITIDIY